MQTPMPETAAGWGYWSLKGLAGGILSYTKTPRAKSPLTKGVTPMAFLLDIAAQVIAGVLVVIIVRRWL